MLSDQFAFRLTGSTTALVLFSYFILFQTCLHSLTLLFTLWPWISLRHLTQSSTIFLCLKCTLQVYLTLYWTGWQVIWKGGAHCTNICQSDFRCLPLSVPVWVQGFSYWPCIFSAICLLTSHAANPGRCHGQPRWRLLLNWFPASNSCCVCRPRS